MALDREPTSLTLTEDLLPVTGAARRAREVVTEACLQWGLEHLVGPATVVVGELVVNAADHAGTMTTLRVSRQTPHLHIAVRDRSPRPLRDRPRARGLRLVENMADSWGHLITPDDKLVWATLAQSRPATTPWAGWSSQIASRVLPE